MTYYEQAPIIEALIDFRVELPVSATLQLLESVYDIIKRQYPVKANRVNVRSVLSVGSEIGASTDQTVMGFAFTSEDGKQIFQARRDGFTFSRLRPYAGWRELRDEARRLPVGTRGHQVPVGAAC
jgi:uncharacterized protein (TIGR04255 family)